MLKSLYKVIGVMSGTSLDGLDLAYVTFSLDENWKFTIEIAETIPYDEFWVEKLMYLSTASSKALKSIDDEYTNYLSETIQAFIKRNKILNFDAICSHGHTALHQPKQGLTCQIGNQKKLSELLKKTVVCNFRMQDVELGGQGAPLVPIGDELLFSDYDYCLNLGGFSNISTKVNGKRIAYDICPINIVLNHYVKQLGYNFDDKGLIAQSGTIQLHLLSELNNLEFYTLKYPKSLGIEWVNDVVFPIIDKYDLTIQDILRTFIEHIAIQIGRQIDHNSKVLVTGGGAYNTFLIERLKERSKANFLLPDKIIIEFKEALIFGFLGVLKLRNEINCLSSVTGAKRDHSSGIVYVYKN